MNDNPPSFCANPPEAVDRPRHAVFVVYPDCVLLDLVGPLQVFSHARQNAQSGPFYQTHVVSLAGGPVRTNTILTIDTAAIADVARGGFDIDTLVIVGGDGAIAAMEDARLIDAVRALAQGARRVSSVCSGALVLAATGLLDGRRAVTHWEDCDHLAAAFPDVQVEVDPIYVRDDEIWTSAGITAGIDMALAMVRDDLGNAPALELARSLVTPMIRSAGQSQFSADLARQMQDRAGRFGALHDWLRGNLAKPITVQDMAAHCRMSARSFSRRYGASVGVPPARSLEQMRVEAARVLLMDTDRSMKAIAQHCGFGDYERMRRAFQRQMHTSPSHYRAQFRAV